MDTLQTKTPAIDVNMPGLNGYQILNIFKVNASLKEVPVDAVTAETMPRDIELGIAAGFTEYLTKPLDVQRLLSIVVTILLPGEH